MINDNKSLRKLCRDIRNNSNGVIGIDTEFIRRFTYYPKLCTIQIVYFNKTENIIIKDIIDTLESNLDIKPFLNILSNNKIKKIIHSSSQDLDAFYFIKNIKFKNIEDTQVMAEFCGYKENISYTNAINSIINKNFKKNKNIQTSNWGKRPLTKKQIEYALNDVEYIIDLYNKLLEKIKKYGNYEYYLNEMKYLLKFRNQKFILKNLWKKIRLLVHKKNMNYVLLVKKLLVWREQKAIENNVIRNRILTDKSIQKIANLKPTTLKELKNVSTRNKDIINLKRIYKIEIVDIVNKFLLKNNSKYVNKTYYTNERCFEQKDMLNYIYNKINELSNEKHINICRLLNKIDIISLIEHYERKNNILYGWKHELMNDLIVNTLSSYNKQIK